MPQLLILVTAYQPIDSGQFQFQIDHDSIWLRVVWKRVLAHGDSRIGRITPLSQNPLSGSCCERLSAGYNSVGAVDDTPPAGEGNEIRLELGVYGS